MGSSGLRRLIWVAAITVVIALALVAGCGCGRRNPVLVKVSDGTNSVEIRKGRYFSRLERVYGSQVMSRLVTETMVELYAKKLGVMPTEEEINAEIEQLKKINKDLDASLQAQNKHIDEWKREREMEMVERRIQTKDVQVTDAEVKSFYDDTVKAKLQPFYRYATIELLMMRFDNKAEADKAYKDLQDGARWADVAQTHLGDQPGDALQTSVNATTWGIDDQGIFGVAQGPTGRVPVRMFRDKANSDTVLGTEIGKYTAPLLETRDQRQVWAIVMVNDKTDAETLPFDEVEYTARSLALLTKALREGKAQEAMNAFEEYKKTVEVQPFDPRFANMKRTAGTEGGEAESNAGAKEKPKAGDGG